MLLPSSLTLFNLLCGSNCLKIKPEFIKRYSFLFCLFCLSYRNILCTLIKWKLWQMPICLLKSSSLLTNFSISFCFHLEISNSSFVILIKSPFYECTSYAINLVTCWFESLLFLKYLQNWTYYLISQLFTSSTISIPWLWKPTMFHIYLVIPSTFDFFWHILWFKKCLLNLIGLKWIKNV